MCAENEYARLVTKMASGVPTIPVSASHNNGDWLETDIYEGELYIDSDTGKLYTRTASGIIDTGIVGSVNIYNSDDALTGDREVDQASNKLWFKNGQFIVGDTDTGIPIWKMLVDGNGAGIVEGGIHVSNGTYGIFAGGSSYGVRASAPLAGWFEGDIDLSGNMVIHQTLAPITPDPSVIFDIQSTEKGSRPVPSMTEAQMNAIVGPVSGLEVFNTTRECKMFYHSYFGWTPVNIDGNPWWGYSFFDESTSSNGPPWTIAFANGGTAVNLTSSALSPTSLYGFSTGVTSNADSQSRTGTYFRASTGKKRTETRVVVSSLSTVTERYVCFFGYLSSTNLLDQANAMYFLYDEGGLSAGSAASANWQCVCAAGSVRTFATTSVPVADQAGGAMQKLRIDDDGTGANVKFYIDDVLVATIATNVPTGTTVNMSNLVRITKAVGTTARNLYVDYTWMREKFNTPR